MEYFLGQIVNGGISMTELLDQNNLPPAGQSNIGITLLDDKENYDMILIPIFYTDGTNYISYSLMVTEGSQTLVMPLGYSNWGQYAQIDFHGGTSATLVDCSSVLSITHIYGIKF